MARRQALLCSYVVELEPDLWTDDEARSAAAYFSLLGQIGCEVVLLDASARERFAEHRRVWRWVGRHEPVHADTADGAVSIIDCAIDRASCEKVIVADQSVRYSAADLDLVLALLERFEIVSPADRVELPQWWHRVEAAQELLRRALSGPQRRSGSFAFCRGPLARVREYLGSNWSSHKRTGADLALHGLNVHAPDLAIDRLPHSAEEWWLDCGRRANDQLKQAEGFFSLTVLPLALVVLLTLGPAGAAGYGAALAAAACFLAARGRFGGGRDIPLHVCLYAPLAVLERSVSTVRAVAGRTLSLAARTRQPATGAAEGSEAILRFRPRGKSAM